MYCVGGMIGFSWVIGPMVGGVLITKLKMGIVSVTRMVFMANLVAFTMIFVNMLIQCPHSEWSGIKHG